MGKSKLYSKKILNNSSSINSNYVDNNGVKDTANVVAGVAPNGGVGENVEYGENIGSTSTYNNNTNLPMKKTGIWGTIRAFLFKEVDVTLTPGQQKFENFINSKTIEVTMTPKQEEIINKMKKFLFQELTFGKAKN